MRLENPTAVPAQVYNPTVQTDLSGSRTLGSTYHNTLTTPRNVQLSVQLAQGAAVTCFSDAGASPSLLVGDVENLNLLGVTCMLSITIIAGNYYQFASSAGVTLVCWIELD